MQIYALLHRAARVRDQIVGLGPDMTIEQLDSAVTRIEQAGVLLSEASLAIEQDRVDF